MGTKPKAPEKAFSEGQLTTYYLICVVQTVGVAVTFEAFSDTVSTAALEVTWMTSSQLCNRQTQDEAQDHRVV